MKPTKLFVYGSLKRGYWNNRIIQHYGGTFLQNATTTLENLKMVANKSYPEVTRQTQEKNKIQGELWEVSEQTLEYCDEMEAGAGYKRETINLEGIDEPVSIYISQRPLNGVSITHWDPNKLSQ